MSRYDILLNDPKKAVPPTKQEPAAAATPTNRSIDEATGRPVDEPVLRREDRPTGRGELIRRGFEWCADQLRALKKLSLAVCLSKSWP
jgi:hypothetical protein